MNWKKGLVMACCILLAAGVYGQRHYFIYLQTENAQPFYIKMGEKYFSSQASGYLILSRLHDSTYLFTLGIPGENVQDLRFQISMERRDHGYLVKNMNQKGWVLFDLQKMQIIEPLVDQIGSSLRLEPRETNAFTQLLARAADDPSLLSRLVLVEEPQVELAGMVQQVKKIETGSKTSMGIDSQLVSGKKPAIREENMIIPAVVKKDTTVEATVTNNKKQETIAIIPEPKKEPATVIEEPEVKKPAEEEPATVVKKENKLIETPVNEGKGIDNDYPATIITRYAESSTTEGFGLVFLDKDPSGRVDTIRIMIPNPGNKFAAARKEEAKPIQEPRFLELDSSNKQVTVSRVSNCKEQAVEEEYFKFRRKLASTLSNDNMIAEAKRQFRARCYTTEQIKVLGRFFLGDANRYQFFQLAMEAVSDPSNFSSLQSELKEEKYRQLFLKL